MTPSIKKYLLLTLFLFPGILELKAQHLTISNLKSLYQNNLEFSNEFLTIKGFEFFKTEENKDGGFSTWWAYERNTNNDRARYFIAKSSNVKDYGIVWYQVWNGDEINVVKNQCKSLGYKLIKIERDKLGSLQSKYSNGVYEVIFTSGIIEESNTNAHTITFQRHFRE